MYHIFMKEENLTTLFKFKQTCYDKNTQTWKYTCHNLPLILECIPVSNYNILCYCLFYLHKDIKWNCRVAGTVTVGEKNSFSVCCWYIVAHWQTPLVYKEYYILLSLESSGNYETQMCSDLY